MPTVEVVRLRGIAETLRQLPTFYSASTKAEHYYRVVSEGARFIREAETLGAFYGDSIYGRIGKKLRHPSCHSENTVPTSAGNVPLWKLCVWYAVVDALAPELISVRSRSMIVDAGVLKAMLIDTSEQEALVVAAAIEVEADRINRAVGKVDNGDLIDRLLTGPADTELTSRELALLEAYLKQPLSSSTIQRERRASRTGESETWNRRKKLKLIRDFNRNLQATARQQSAPSAADTPVDPASEGTKGKRSGRPKADYETIQHEAELAKDWARAREMKVYKGDFARDNNMSVKDLDRLLERVAKRKKSSE